MQFTVLPDSPAGAALARRLPADDTCEVLYHASGRPWIVGSWSPAEVRLAQAGGRRLALLGCTRIGADALRSALDRAGTLRDLDALARSLPGAAHLIASFDGRVRAQGTVTGVRQLHHGQADGVTVAADRADLLAALTGGGIRTASVARQLLAPMAPWPLNALSPWAGTQRLPGDSYLELPPDGRARVVRWWTAPEPELPLAAGAERLRVALREAVAARTDGGGTVSADLSGGMDSTSLCFLLGERTEARVVTSRWEAADAANDDWVWARKATAELPDAEHTVTARGTGALWFADAMEPGADTEAPFPWIRTRAQQLVQVRQLAASGSTRHLTGHGGDELFYALPTYLHALVRARPQRALRIVRAGSALYRWKPLPTLRALADNRPYGRWLGAAADTLTAPPPPPSQPDFGWGTSPRMPRWATPDAVETVRGLLRDAASAGPLAPQRAQHMVLEYARECGSTLRLVDRLTSTLGVSWHAPYVDDRVVEAVLSLRIADRADNSGYKRPLATAMRGIVPDDILGRPTKAEFSAEVYAGLQRHRRELAAHCDDLRLARLGLVDAEALRAALLGLHPSSRTLVPLDATLACESWLRSLPATATPVPAASGGSR